MLAESSQRRTSNIKPRGNQDIFHVKNQSQKHFGGQRKHQDKEQRGNREPHHSPAFEKLSSFYLQNPKIECGNAEDKISADHDQTESRRPPIVPETEKIRQIDVGERHDLVRIPALHRPEKIPALDPKDSPDDDHRNP